MLDIILPVTGGFIYQQKHPLESYRQQVKLYGPRNVMLEEGCRLSLLAATTALPFVFLWWGVQ